MRTKQEPRMLSITVRSRPKSRPPRPADPQLAAAMDGVYEAGCKDPNRFHNNPARHREALEGFGRWLAEWEVENGAITEEDIATARALISGDDLRS